MKKAATQFQHGDLPARSNVQEFLPDQTHVQQVRLKSRNAGVLLAFYRDVLGLKPIGRVGPETALSGDGNQPAVLVLVDDPNAPAHSSNSAGLFHVAIRYPNRAALARAALRLMNNGYPLDGASDHIVSEALYLRDPDGNGVELYVDRPREQWIWRDGQVAMSTEPLDLDDLLAAAQQRASSNSEGPPQIGHVHLRVTDLAQAERFYHEFLGLAVTQRSYPGALFFSAGGYHHHIAVNTWGSPGPARENSAGLVSYRIAVPVPELLYCLNSRAPLMGYQAELLSEPNGAQLLKVRDSNGNWLEIVPEGNVSDGVTG